MNKGAKPASEAIIRLIGIEKSFGDQQVLNGVDLDVPEGTTTIIVGASGQGKSVMVKHMLGLIKPDKGQVLVYGEDINKVKSSRLKEIRTTFGVLFQNQNALWYGFPGRRAVRFDDRLRQRRPAPSGTHPAG